MFDLLGCVLRFVLFVDFAILVRLIAWAYCGLVGLLRWLDLVLLCYCRLFWLVCGFGCFGGCCWFVSSWFRLLLVFVCCGCDWLLMVDY